MKLSFNKIIMALFVLLMSQSNLFSTAYVQVIHNAADPAAALVDLYVNGETKLDDVAFRDATGYLELPSGTAIEISVNAPTSMDVNDGQITTVNFDPLMDGGEYILIANGLVGDGFEVIDAERTISFDIYAVEGRRTGQTPATFDLRVWHGSTDAPAVDIYANGGDTPLVPNLDYSETAGWVPLPAATYELTLNVAGTDTEAGTWIAPVSAELMGGTGIVLASGFLTPDNEGQTIPESHHFDLILVLADGTVIELPVKEEEEAGPAYVQVIHNSADPAAALVDIYINGVTKLDDVAFRDATPYVALPSGLAIEVSINAPTSESVDDGQITTINFDPLMEDGEYILVANGLVGDGFEMIDENRMTSFDIYAVEGKRMADESSNLDIKVWHGSTDAPAVDIYTNTSNMPLISNLDYASSQGWVGLGEGTYELTLNVAGTETAAGTWIAPVSDEIVGGTGIILASGFLSPDNEGQTIPESHHFDLILVLADGTVIELPMKEDEMEDPMAYVQVIHNSADPAAALVDLYINGETKLDDVAFRDATPYLALPAGVAIEVSVNAPTSMNVDDGQITTVNFDPLMEDGEYILIANGLVGDGFESIDAMRSTSFDIYAVEGRRMAENMDNFDIRVWHGATDAPAVDIYANGGDSPLVPNLDYANSAGWVPLAAGDYNLTLNVAGTSTAAGTWLAPVSEALLGQTGIILASGFLSPDNEGQMIPESHYFGLILVTNDGTVIPLPTVTSVEDNEIQIEAFPNPFNDQITISNEQLNGNLNLEIYNSLGEIVRTQKLTNSSTHQLNQLGALPNGVYFIKVGDKVVKVIKD